MVAENVQRVSRKGASRNMHNHRHKLARNFIHIGDHQQKSLRSGVSARQSTRAKRTVNGARSSAFRLHFSNLNFLTPHVCPSRGSPFVGDFRHRGRGSDGVNCRYLRKGIRNVTRGGIAVDCQFFHQETSD